MKRIIIIVAIIFAVLIGAGGATFGAFIWRFTPQIPKVRFDETENSIEARLQDLDYLRLYADADWSFSEDEEVALNAHIDELEARVESLTNAEFIMGVTAAGAITENGHSGVGISDAMNLLNSLPVRFAWFADGLHIVRAHEEYADIIGSRVVAYEGQSPEIIYPQMDPYFGGNDALLRQNSAYYFAAPASLHAAGLINQPDIVTLELINSDGETTFIELRVEDNPTYFDWQPRYQLSQSFEFEQDSGYDWHYLDPAMTQATWYGRHPERALWADSLAHGGAYWRLRNVYGDAEATLPGWLEEQAQSLKDNPANYLVIDLRANVGGDYTLAMGVAKKVAELVQPEGRIYVLTDGDTFSAGIVTAFYALYGGGENAIYAGETVGDDMQFWAEGGGKMMRLPNSDIGLFLSTGYHDWENGCKDWSKCFWVNILFGVALGSIELDLEAPLLFADYARGVDSGIEAILAAEIERLQP